MTAKLASDIKDSLTTLTDHLSWLQVRAAALAKLLAQVSRKSPSSERAGIETSSQVLAKLSRRAADLQTAAGSSQRQRSGSGSGSGGASGPWPRGAQSHLSTDATLQLLALLMQCDAVLDTINGTDSAACIERCSTPLQVVSATLAFALQCLRHAQLLDGVSTPGNQPLREQTSASRSRLERYVFEQQAALLQWLHDDLSPAPKRRNSRSGRREQLADLDQYTVVSLLDAGLRRPEQGMYSKIGHEQIEHIVEQHAQDMFLRWVTRTTWNTFNPVFSASPEFSPPPGPPPRRDRSSLPDGFPMHSGTAHSRVPAFDPPMPTSSHIRRHSAATPSPASMFAGPSSRLGSTNAFQPSSFPPSSLRDPPFAVTHGRVTAQAHANAQVQASIQAQAQARKQTRRLSSTSATAAHTRRDSTSAAYDKTSSSPASDTSSLAPTTADPQHSRPITWRLSARGHHWDYENEALVHNTGSLPPQAARVDRQATTEIRKSLLTPRALAELLGGRGGGVGEQQVGKWQVVERKVVNGDRSQRKKFVRIGVPLTWREVEALVRRSGEIVERGY